MKKLLAFIRGKCYLLIIIIGVIFIAAMYSERITYPIFLILGITSTVLLGAATGIAGRSFLEGVLCLVAIMFLTYVMIPIMMYSFSYVFSTSESNLGYFLIWTVLFSPVYSISHFLSKHIIKRVDRPTEID